MPKAFQYLTIGVFLILIIPWLVQDGMFMDGMIYATVARNLSLGIGNWWNLHLTNYLSNQYFDQPPLTIWITSWFFKVLGYSMYTERIYSFITAIINLLLIKAIWQKINFKNEKYRENWWLPVLLWIIPPVSFWIFTNNMQENTMGIFILSSVYFLFDTISRSKNKIVPVLLMAVCIFLSAMCKGIQGTFTIIGFLAYTIAVNRSTLKPALLYTLIIGIILSTLFISLYLYPPSNAYFTGYYHARILKTFTSHEMSTTDNRFYLLIRLLTEEITPIIICITILLVSQKLNTAGKILKPDYKYTGFFILIALCGTLPLLITTEQRRFYLAPAFPFYAFALSFLVIEHLINLIELLNSRKNIYTIKIVGVSLMLITAILAISNAGTFKRDHKMLSDVYKIGTSLPLNSNIGIDQELFHIWILHIYFQRYYGISLDASNDNISHTYFLSEKKGNDTQDRSSVNLDLKLYHLKKQNDPTGN